MAQDLVPRAPVTNAKSGTIDYTDKYTQMLQRFREAARQQAQRDLEENKEWANLGKYIAALEGNFWSMLDPRRPGYRARFVDNQLARARKDTLAMYTDVRPNASVTSLSFNQQATILTEVLGHQWTKRDFDIRLAEVLDHALFSVGFWKVNGGPGALTVRSCGMDTVMPINATSDLQEASAILYRTFKPLSYFHARFKDKIDKIKANALPASGSGGQTYHAGMMISEYSYNNLSPAMRRVMRDRVPPRDSGRTGDVFPVASLEELWVEDVSENTASFDVIVKDPDLDIAKHNYWYRVKPGERLFPRKRLIIFGGNEPCYDGPSPFWTPKYPFARLALDPVVWAAGGMSKYRTLLPLNHTINEIGAGVVDVIRKAINQTVAYKQGTIRDADWDRFFPDMPGAKLRMTPIGNPLSDINYVQPPNLPSYVMEFLMRYLNPIFDRHAGTVDMNSVMRKGQVPGGDVLEQIRDSQAGPVRLETRRVETFLRDAGEIGVSHILQYFSPEDRYRILAEQGWTIEDFDRAPRTMVPAGMAKESFYKEFGLNITPGSMHGANKDREEVKSLTMFKSGAMSLQTLLKKANIGDGGEEYKRIMQERQAEIPPEEGGSGRTPRLSRGQRNGALA